MSATRMKKSIYQIHALCLALTFSIPAISAEREGVPVTGEASHKLERHFDRDKNGSLDQMERMNLRTHLVFHYPLIQNDKQLPYDVDGDQMMTSFEMRQYLKDKASGRLKSVYKEYKEKKKREERLRQDRFKQIEAQNEILRFKRH